MKRNTPITRLSVIPALCCLTYSQSAFLLAAAPTGTAPQSVLAERPEDQADDEVGRIKLKRPGERDFIVDLAELISSPDE